jgi:hypothetical protein
VRRMQRTAQLVLYCEERRRGALEATEPDEANTGKPNPSQTTGFFPASGARWYHGRLATARCATARYSPYPFLIMRPSAASSACVATLWRPCRMGLLRERVAGLHSARQARIDRPVEKRRASHPL